MTALQKFFRLALPAGLVVFCWLTMRSVAAFADESMTSFGFPLAWYTTDPVSSVGHVVAVLPLLIDLAVYVVAAAVAVSLLVKRPRRWLSAAAVMLWLLAAVSVAAKVTALAINPQLVAWTLDGYYGSNAQRSHGLQLGLQP